MIELCAIAQMRIRKGGEERRIEPQDPADWWPGRELKAGIAAITHPKTGTVVA
ncbi:hypothetical protein V1291_004654 [Nitrobacteraceae bacterium AZCC 1564]